MQSFHFFGKKVFFMNHLLKQSVIFFQAVNNMSVCCLYMGKLKEALKSLEALVHQDPSKNLHEGILFNLCTLYELESSRALHKKQALLDLVSKHKGDGFPVVCLKMV